MKRGTEKQEWGNGNIQCMFYQNFRKREEEKSNIWNNTVEKILELTKDTNSQFRQ